MVLKDMVHLPYVCFLVFVIPGIVGIVLLVIRTTQDKAVKKRYGTIDGLDEKIQSLDKDFVQRQASYRTSLQEYGVLVQQRRKELSDLQTDEQNAILDSYVTQYDFSDYDGLSSEECRTKLSLLKKQQKDRIKAGEYICIDSDDGKKRTNDNVKQIIRCFNCECDNILYSLSVKTIDNCRKKMIASFESLNKIFDSDGIQLTDSFLEDKLEELNLVYTYELKREQEREQQKEIKEQLLEEERVRKEIERQKAKLEKDQAQCSNEIAKLISYMKATQSDMDFPVIHGSDYL